MTDRLRETYREEAFELLAELETSLLELEERPQDQELVGRVFRALHTIKGSGAMFGFDDIAAFAHELETAFDSVRSGRLTLTPELIGLTLEGRDHILHLLEGPGEAAPAAPGIVERLRRLAPLPGPLPAPMPPTVPPAVAAAPPGPPQSYRIRFVPVPDILLSGVNPMLTLRELEGLGGLSLMAHVDDIPELSELDPERCYTHWDAILTTAAGENAIRDVFIFVEDLGRLTIERIAEETAAEHAPVGKVLVERGDASAEHVEECLANRPLAGDLLVQAGLAARDRVDAALLEQQHLDAMRARHPKAEAAASLRVPAARLDSLLDIVGELVTVQARLSGHALASPGAEINFIAEEVERLTERLRGSAMSLRMLPIGETFGRFKRLVHDLSAELGKKAELSAEGNDTELDKTVIEQLSDPLVHLVRNAVDHGVEMPERRAARGKPAAGRVHLAARHSGAFVLIEVSDDGAGMDREAIRARAVERGLIRADAVLSDEEIFAFTLSPGFSTANRVTSVSGRGVGMDVVKRSMEQLRGTIAVASRAGEGTTVTLKIPLTLAIVDGLLVDAGGSCFVAPLSNISGCIELRRKGRSGRRKLAEVRGELVPWIALRERFALPGEAPDIEQMIVADTLSGRVGFVVDRVIGDHHAVIKKLGLLYRQVGDVSGATILGDGTVALILDLDAMTADVIQESRRN